MSNMKFGIFMAPFHNPAGQDPISAYQRDLEIIQHLDKLGYDEACERFPPHPCPWGGQTAPQQQRVARQEGRRSRT